MRSVRAKLIELLAQGIFYAEKTNVDNAIKFTYAAVVDYLMANGVTMQKQGKWIRHRNGHIECPCCNTMYERLEPRNFCSECGCKMNAEE